MLNTTITLSTAAVKRIQIIGSIIIIAAVVYALVYGDVNQFNHSYLGGK